MCACVCALDLESFPRIKLARFKSRRCCVYIRSFVKSFVSGRCRLSAGHIYMLGRYVRRFTIVCVLARQE